MLDALSFIMDIGYAAIYGYCLQYFYGSFLENKGRDRRRSSLCAAITYGLVRLLLETVLPTDYSEIRTVIGNLFLTFGLLTVIVFLFYKSWKTITIYLVTTLMAVMQLSFFLAYSIYTLGAKLNQLWIWCMDEGYISDGESLMTIVWITVAVFQVLMIVIFFLLSYRSLHGIVRSFREKEYDIHRDELLFILAPSLAGLLICVLLRVITITIDNGVTELLYDKYPVLILVVPIILILCLLTILYGVKLFQDMIYLNKERNSRVILEKQVSSMQEQITEIEQIYSGIRSMKHDMKNTLSVIKQLAAESGSTQNAELQAYLSEINQSFDRFEFHFKTGNTVVDTLLNIKYHEIMRAMPNLHFNADELLFPKNLYIQSYDISIVLGNALDNAMDACKKLMAGEREEEIFIRFHSFLKGKMFFIRIENSFDGEVKRRRGAEFPTTTKSDQKVHGIGLTNIKNTAEKYHGGVDWAADGKVFTLTVMLKNERSDDFREQ